MLKFNFKVSLIYVFILVYLVLNFCFAEYFNTELFTNVLIPLIWFGIFIYSYIFCKPHRYNRVRLIEKNQVVIIILIIYFIVYYLFGLWLGFNKSPYSHSIDGILLNIWRIIPIIFLEEYVRFVLCSHTRKKNYLFVVIVIFFTLLEINFATLPYVLKTGTGAFKFLCEMVLPSLFKNILLTYLMTISNYVPAMIYRVTFELSYILLPIFPDLDWFVNGLFGVITPMVLYINLNYIEASEDREVSTRVVKKSKPIRTVPIFICMFLLVCFVAGIFKYKPVAVISNSMVPKFSRGDAIIVEKYSSKDMDKLKVQDIIEFNDGRKTVIHRIIEIQYDDNNEIMYVTKGDNNNAPDSSTVKQEQIKGVAKWVIPKLGYPSVWLYEFLGQFN